MNDPVCVISHLNANRDQIPQCDQFRFQLVTPKAEGEEGGPVCNIIDYQQRAFRGVIEGVLKWLTSGVTDTSWVGPYKKLINYQPPPGIGPGSWGCVKLSQTGFFFILKGKIALLSDCYCPPPAGDSETRTFSTRERDNANISRVFDLFCSVQRKGRISPARWSFKRDIHSWTWFQLNWFL